MRIKHIRSLKNATCFVLLLILLSAYVFCTMSTIQGRYLGEIPDEKLTDTERDDERLNDYEYVSVLLSDGHVERAIKDSRGASVIHGQTVDLMQVHDNLVIK